LSNWKKWSAEADSLKSDIIKLGPLTVPAPAKKPDKTEPRTTLARAVVLHLDGKPEDALDTLTLAVEGGDQQPELFSALGHIQFDLGKYADASRSYFTLLEMDPKHPAADFNLAICLEKLGKWEDAAAAFRKALQADPKKTEAQLGLGTCLLQLENWELALVAFDRFLGQQPDREQAVLGKAVALHQLGKLDEAQALYLRILQKNPKSEETLTNLIALSTKKRDLERVKKYSDMLREVQPQSQTALEALATCAFAGGDFASAAGHCEELTIAAPDHFEGWFNLGVARQKLGNWEKAIEAYLHAVQLNPKDAHVKANLGTVYQESGDLDKARAAYEGALALDANLPAVIWNLALLLERKGHKDEAEKLYAKLPEKTRDSEDALFRLGYLRLQRGDFRGAVEAFEGCVKKRSPWPEAEINAGIAHQHLGDFAAARKAFDAVLAANPDSLDALRGAAALALDREDTERALDLHCRLITLGERRAEVLYNAGFLFQKKGLNDDAARFYKEALTAEPEFAEALLNLGHALKALGQEQEARSCWRRAVETKPELARGYFDAAAV
jgi:tetratricopeptide (TPR) repeat protein